MLAKPTPAGNRVLCIDYECWSLNATSTLDRFASLVVYWLRVLIFECWSRSYRIIIRVVYWLRVLIFECYERAGIYEYEVVYWLRVLIFECSLQFLNLTRRVVYWLRVLIFECCRSGYSFRGMCCVLTTSADLWMLNTRCAVYRGCCVLTTSADLWMLPHQVTSEGYLLCIDYECWSLNALPWQETCWVRVVYWLRVLIFECLLSAASTSSLTLCIDYECWSLNAGSPAGISKQELCIDYECWSLNAKLSFTTIPRSVVYWLRVLIFECYVSAIYMISNELDYSGALAKWRCRPQEVKSSQFF